VKFEISADKKYTITETTPAIPSGITATTTEIKDGKKVTKEVTLDELEKMNMEIKGDMVFTKVRTTRGTQDYMQSLKADKYEEKNFKNIETWEIGTLNAFDDL